MFKVFKSEVIFELRVVRGRIVMWRLFLCIWFGNDFGLLYLISVCNVANEASWIIRGLPG